MKTVLKIVAAAVAVGAAVVAIIAYKDEIASLIEKFAKKLKGLFCSEELSCFADLDE